MSEEDNRKGVHQQDDVIAANSGKRASFAQSGNQDGNSGEDGVEPLFFKLLCPQGITGLIIGKGGANIIQLNATTGARIKLSQNNEYFPNTTDRILLISGAKEGIENAIRELVSRIVEAPEKRQSPGEFGKSQAAPKPNGSYTIRVLIPKVASAAVIGKSGSVIKRMSEQSSCRYQLGEENDPFNTNERIVTITGSASQNVVMGAVSIMNQLLDEPRVRTYMNPTTNYSGRGNAPHPPAPQNMQQMMGSPPAAAMMPTPGFVPYGAIPTPYMTMQYPGMSPMQVPMQQPMYTQGMAVPPGYPMQPGQFSMNAATPQGPAYVPGPPMYAGQYSPGQPANMDMSHLYQQHHQQQLPQQQQQQPQQPQQQPQQHYGGKPMYVPHGAAGMQMSQQIPPQQMVHQQPQVGTSHYNNGNSYNGGKMK